MSQGFLSVSPEEEINQWGEHQKQDTYNTRATCRNPACPLFLLSRLGLADECKVMFGLVRSRVPGWRSSGSAITKKPPVLTGFLVKRASGIVSR